MAVHSSQSRLLIGELSFSGYMRRATHRNQVGTFDKSSWLDTAHVRGFTMATGELSAGEFIVDETTNEALDAAMDGLAGQPVTLAPQGFVIGTQVKFINAMQGSFDIAAPFDGLVTGSLGFVTQDGLGYGGPSLHDLAAETSSGNGTSVDNAAASASGGAAILHATAFTGLTNAVVKVQHSTNNSTWVDLATFATLTDVGAELVTVTGTVNRYLRALWTLTGTGSITFTVGFGRL